MQERQLDPRTAYALRPLRWVAQEDLVYDPDSRTLHRRAACALQDAGLAAACGIRARAGVGAAGLRCGPDVTLALGDA